MRSPFWKTISGAASKFPYLNRLFHTLNRLRSDLDQSKAEIERLKADIELLRKELLVRGGTAGPSVFDGYCTVCGRHSFFLKTGDNLRETYNCENCHSNSRNRHLSKVLIETFAVEGPCSLDSLIAARPGLAVYESQASGAIHDRLKALKNYTCSEYFADVAPGSLSASGILCQDIQRLSFPDNSFDLVITQDVMEHVREPELAWKEIYRVLKPGGYHVFTVPWDREQKTVRRVKLDGEKEVHVLPRRVHEDGIRDGLVYTDFGYDMIEELDATGFHTSVHYNTEQESQLYRIYRSYIFVSAKA